MGRKALIIGIDEYQTAPLHGCVNDAKEIASLLKTNEDDSKNFDVRLELNIQKKEKLSDAIQSLFAGDDEIVLDMAQQKMMENISVLQITPITILV